MNPGRQRPHTQPITGMDRQGRLRINAQQVTACVMIAAYLADRLFAGLGSSAKTQKFAHQQSPASGLCGKLRLRSIRHGNKQTVFIDPQPGAPCDGVNTSDGPASAFENAGGIASPLVELFAICADDNRRVLDHAEE